MDKSELFLLFPIYCEVEEESHSHYINRIDIMEEGILNDFLKKIDYVNDFFQYKRYDGYYDAKNVEAFFYPLDLLEECYPNKKTLVRSILKKWGENWRIDRKQDDNECYMYYCTRIQDDTLCEITKRKILDKSQSYLLINHNAFLCRSEFVRTKCDENDIEISVANINIKNIANWFENNRKPERVYHWNPKHGENGKGAHPSNNGDKVSILMGSNGEAKMLLKKAIGIDLKTMFYYDVKNEQYIEFKREAENTYHAFHLDSQDEVRVPREIKAKIKILEL